MKRILLLSLVISFLVSCEILNDSIPTISKDITTKYLLDGIANGNLDLYLHGAQVFRYKGQPGTEAILIGNPDLSKYENCFIMHVATGTTQSTTVSSAIIKLDGLEVLNTSDFSKNTGSYIFEVCNITSTSSLSVEVRGEPGSYIDIWIEGKLKPVIPIDGLLLYFPFSEEDINLENGTVLDRSGNNNDGILYGPTNLNILDRHDEAKSCLHFDGNDYIQIPNDIVLTKNLTFSCWAKRSDKGPRTIISKRNGQWGDPGNNCYQYGFSEAEGGQLLAWLWGTNTSVELTSIDINTNDWTHIAVTYDGSMVKFYIDGEMKANYPNSGNLQNYSHQTRIGDDWWHNYFLGDLDEIRVYSRALNDQEIKLLAKE
jgi:hypothetical protein